MLIMYKSSVEDSILRRNFLPLIHVMNGAKRLRFSHGFVKSRKIAIVFNQIKLSVHISRRFVLYITVLFDMSRDCTAQENLSILERE